MANKVVRMTEERFVEMINDTVHHLIKEGTMADFMKGFNAKGVGKYAFEKLWMGHDVNEIGQDPQDLKDKKNYEEGYKDGKGGKRSKYDKEMTSTNTESSSESTENQQQA